MTTMTQAGSPPQTPMAKPASPKGKESPIEEFLRLRSDEYELSTEHGQRRLGPPRDWRGPPPPRGSEVFVGKVPRDLFEDELVPLFEQIGPLYEVRLMMEYGNGNRGYAFVMYTCTEDAKKAIEELNNNEIRKGRHLGVCKSVDNCRLFVGGIPKAKTRPEILAEMRRTSEGVADVILYSSAADKARNRGFAFIEYESHRAAAAARRKLMAGRGPLWGHEVAVDWAEPEPEVDDRTMAKVTILYVRNLMMTTTEEKLRELFSLQDSLKVDKVKKLRDFAFVHYRTREDAEAALEQLNNTDIDGSTVEVTWAKPVDKFTRQRNCNRLPQQPPHNQFLYGPPPYEHFVPFPNCPGRGALLHRFPMRGRGRGAAGIRRFRNFVPNSGPHSPYKSQEVPHPHSPMYSQFQPNKLGRIPEEGKPYAPEYMYIVNSAAEGMDPAMAVSGPALMPYGPHPRMPHPAAFLHAAPGFDEMACYTYLPNPSGSISSY